MVMRGKEEQRGILLKKEDIDQNNELWSHWCLYSVSQAVSVTKRGTDSEGLSKINKKKQVINSVIKYIHKHHFEAQRLWI